MEFSRQGRRILDAQVIYHKLEPRDLAAAYRKYCGKELENSHTSEVDVQAAAEILECQLDAHPELPRDVTGLHGFCNPEEANWIDPEGKFVWSEGEVSLGFGRYKGQSLKEVVTIDTEYLQWIASGDFSTETKK